jgi:hypothetical protein
MVAYVAVALIDAGEPAETVHCKTYDIVAASLPPDRFAELTQSSAYREAVAADAARFAAQLPFYEVKPVYPAMMSLLYRAGMNLVTASVVISAGSHAGICLLLYLWIAAGCSPPERQSRRPPFCRVRSLLTPRPFCSRRKANPGMSSSPSGARPLVEREMC